jgi:hypothetical protein
MPSEILYPVALVRTDVSENVSFPSSRVHSIIGLHGCTISVEPSKGQCSSINKTLHLSVLCIYVFYAPINEFNPCISVIVSEDVSCEVRTGH